MKMTPTQMHEIQREAKKLRVKSGVKAKKTVVIFNMKQTTAVKKAAAKVLGTAKRKRKAKK